MRIAVMDGDGLSLSKRRITLSTSGVVPMMARAGAEIGVNLAVSLHAVTKEVRDEIVPLNRKYGIEELLQACARLSGLSNARRITFEYVMLKDNNDSTTMRANWSGCSRAFARQGQPDPVQPLARRDLMSARTGADRKILQVVFNAGYASPVRTPRGRDILAACGQLKSARSRCSPVTTRERPSVSPRDSGSTLCSPMSCLATRQARWGKASRLRARSMVGDGVNDAPALDSGRCRLRDRRGDHVAMESADIVLMKSYPFDVVGALELSRATLRKMHQNLWWAVGYNVIAFPLAAGVL